MYKVRFASSAVSRRGRRTGSMGYVWCISFWAYICRVGVSVQLCALCYGPPIGLEHLGEAWTSMNYSPPYEMVLWQVGGGWSGLGFVTPASSVIANLKPVPWNGEVHVLARVQMTPSFPPRRLEGKSHTYGSYTRLFKKWRNFKKEHVLRNEKILAFQLDVGCESNFLRHADRVPCCGDICELPFTGTPADINDTSHLSGSAWACDCYQVFEVFYLVLMQINLSPGGIRLRAHSAGEQIVAFCWWGERGAEGRKEGKRKGWKEKSG